MIAAVEYSRLPPALVVEVDDVVDGQLPGNLARALVADSPILLLDDPTVEEVWINAPDRVFCARDGVSELTSIVLDARQVRDLVERMGGEVTSLGSGGEKRDCAERALVFERSQAYFGSPHADQAYS